MGGEGAWPPLEGRRPLRPRTAARMPGGAMPPTMAPSVKLDIGINYGIVAEQLKIRNSFMCTRRSAERHLGNQGAFGRDGVGKIGMLARVDVILAAGEHRDRSAREAPAMGGRVDAARKP